MSLTAKVDLAKSPITLTVVSDKRLVTGSVTVAGETAQWSGTFEPKVVDDSGRVWVKQVDDGTTAVYTS